MEERRNGESRKRRLVERHEKVRTKETEVGMDRMKPGSALELMCSLVQGLGIWRYLLLHYKLEWTKLVHK